MAQDLSKLKKKKARPPVIPKPDDPAALYRSKAEQLEINKKQRLARKKAEEAYRKAMGEETEEENTELKQAENALIQQKQLLKSLLGKRDELNDEIADSEGSDKRSLKMQLGKVSKKVEEAETKIADIEEEIENLK